MELDKEFSMSNVKGNIVAQHHKVNVMGTGWAPASSVGTSYIYPHKTVLNFSLHEGGNVVMPEDVYAATFGYAMPEGSLRGLRTYFPTYPGEILSRLGNIRSSTPGTVRLRPCRLPLWEA